MESPKLHFLGNMSVKNIGKNMIRFLNSKNNFDKTSWKNR